MDMRQAARHGEAMEVDPGLFAMGSVLVEKNADAASVPVFDAHGLFEKGFMGLPLLAIIDRKRIEARRVFDGFPKLVGPRLGQFDFDFGSDRKSTRLNSSH